MNTRISFAMGQRRLATIWLVGSALLITIMVAQSYGEKYGTQVEKAWGWLLPLVSPMLLLIIGAVIAEARAPRPDATVETFVYRITLGMSVFYLLLTVLTIVLQPLTGMTPLEIMSVSNLWLGPLQGLVGMAMGFFFQSRRG